MRYAKLFEEGVKRLEGVGIAEANTDCFILFSEAFGLSRASYFFKKEEEIPAGDADKIELYFSWLLRRENHEPVQYIIGNQEFCGLTFKVTPDVLIPRLDTEILVEEVLKNEGGACSVLDLCTGSGCILISLMKLGTFKRGVGTDISGAALEIARENADENGVEVKLLQGDLFEALDVFSDEEKRFDVIVSNPPYIAESERKDLADEVLLHEPQSALFAENNGLIFYERILACANKFLADHGTIYFEIGCSQAAEVMRLCVENGFKNVSVTKDLAGLDRVIRASL